jgi:sugar phosphate isomerase/epimerase
MKRREFLTGAAALTTFGLAGAAQAPAPAAGQAPAGNQGAAQGRGRVGGGAVAPLGNPGAPANVPERKLARISLMQLNFNAVLIPQPSANNPNPTPTANQTLTIFDLPKVYVENYGVHNIEFQHGNILKSETDPSFIKELKAKLDEYKMTMTQINLEIGQVESMSNADPAGRAKGIEHIKQWIDIASQYGCKRIMLNQQQGQLTKDRRTDAVAFMKAAADAGRPKGVMISVETRGAAQPQANGVEQPLGVKPWEFMAGIIKDAGANSNVDIGNVGANNQTELDECIKAWFPYSSGNMHIKSSPLWDIGAAVRFTESLGYKGNYAIEVGAYAAMRMVYNQILANLA